MLDIMVRRGHWTAREDQVAGPVVPPAGHAGMLDVLRGRWQPGAEGRLPASGQGVWRDGDDEASGGAVAPLSPDAAALWADVPPAE
ncbi:hypothetical protein [Streptomyces sp. NBC_01353]|uniref:hypothetical protein n=1 Tax=Streptomyces sp. NBC_01353 TaxID=2903835 RepID=UPI002E34BB09|nr:hypothetical protein [Streptomyces sp. NBC_01353]